MSKWLKKFEPYKARFIVAMLSLMPLLAKAEWDDTANDEFKKIRVALYALTGTIAVATLIWRGAQWLIARSQGDHSITAMDYIQQVLIIVVVGGSVALAVYAWGLYATSAG